MHFDGRSATHHHVLSVFSVNVRIHCKWAADTQAQLTPWNCNMHAACPSGIGLKSFLVAYPACAVGLEIRAGSRESISCRCSHSSQVDVNFVLASSLWDAQKKSMVGQLLHGASAWKSSLKTAKKLRPNRTQTTQDQKFPGPPKTATTVRSTVHWQFEEWKTEQKPVLISLNQS